jgi:hypothetical protein
MVMCIAVQHAKCMGGVGFNGERLVARHRDLVYRDSGV